MSEEGRAREFEEGLGAARRGERPAPDADPEELALVRSLYDADFSAESRVRDGLRSALLEKAAGRAGPARRPGWTAALVPAAALAALALALTVYVSDEPPHRPDSAAGAYRGRAGDRILVSAPRDAGRMLVPEQIGTPEPGGDGIALGTKAGIDRLTAGDLMESFPASVVDSEAGRTVTWRVGDDVFILESRKTGLRL